KGFYLLVLLRVTLDETFARLTTAGLDVCFSPRPVSFLFQRHCLDPNICAVVCVCVCVCVCVGVFAEAVVLCACLCVCPRAVCVCLYVFPPVFVRACLRGQMVCGA